MNENLGCFFNTLMGPLGFASGSPDVGNLGGYVPPSNTYKIVTDTGDALVTNTGDNLIHV